MTRNNFIDVDGSRVFYREAGRQDAPAVLLLHGFPSSSHMFRQLIPRLAERYRVVAPDLPGFGFTEPRVGFDYTFDGLAKLVEGFTDAVGLRRYAIYVFDYGAPVGFRLAMARPERIDAIVTQNGNSYDVGLSDAWIPIRAYWTEPTAERRETLRAFLAAETTKWQYTVGTPPGATVAPESYVLDQALLDRPGNAEIQLDLMRDYATNVALYPKFQEYFRTHSPRLLAIWGKNDPFFLPAGAEAFRRDLPEARVKLLDTGHFALETHAEEIAMAMTDFLGLAQPNPLHGGSREVEGKAVMKTTDVVRAFYDGLSRGDLASSLELLTSDVHWVDPKGFPYGGDLQSPAEVRAKVFERMLGDFAPFAIHVERVLGVDDGESVAVLGTYRGTFKATGKSVEAPFVHVWTGRGEKLASFAVHTDTAAFQSAMR